MHNAGRQLQEPTAMTVAELIAELQKWPGDRKVCINTGEWPGVLSVTHVVVYTVEWQSQPKCAVHGFVDKKHQRGGPYGVCALCHPWEQRVDLDNLHPLKMERRAIDTDSLDVVIEGHEGQR
jgi:hypothetical protein